MLQVWFTKSDTFTSRIIRAVTGEPVSHVALVNPSLGQVLHAMPGTGTTVMSVPKFRAENSTIAAISFPALEEEIFARAVQKYLGRPYDWAAISYLAVRRVCPWLPKKNLWQCSGMAICTEIIQYVVPEVADDAALTPWQLYQALVKSKK